MIDFNPSKAIVCPITLIFLYFMFMYVYFKYMND